MLAALEGLEPLRVFLVALAVGLSLPEAVGRHALGLTLTWSAYHYAAQAYGLSVLYAYRSGCQLSGNDKRLLWGVSLLPFVIGMSGWLYLAGALALGGGFIYWAIVLLRNRNPRGPIETFRYSILYLGLLFAILLIDHYWIATPLPAPAGMLEFQRL